MPRIRVAYWITYSHSLCPSCLGIKYACPFPCNFTVLLTRGELYSFVLLIKALLVWFVWSTDYGKKWHMTISRQALKRYHGFPLLVVLMPLEECNIIINCWPKNDEGHVQTWTQSPEPGAQILKSSLPKPRNPQPMIKDKILKYCF